MHQVSSPPTPDRTLPDPAPGGESQDRSARLVDRLWPPLAVTVLSFCIGYLQKLPCQTAGWARQPDVIYGERCYSDMPFLFAERGLIGGIFPYSSASWQHPLEYPVLSGLLMDATARFTRWIYVGADVSALSRAYFAVNTVVLLCFALLLTAATWALLRKLGGRPHHAFLVAAAPTLVLTGTINWDLLAVAAAVAALLAWRCERPVLAGALIGLGMTAKLFPLFLLGPIILDACLRRRWGAGVSATLTSLVTIVAINAPIAVLFPRGWLVFWTFNSERAADLGSIWYALRLLSGDFSLVNLVAPAALLLSWSAIAAWTLRSASTPGVELTAFLTIAAFLVTNKVYSPQYVLWLLPLAVLCLAHLPLQRTLPIWLVWQAAEVWYWYCVWDHLLPDRSLRLSQPSGVYVASIAVRIGATALMCFAVIRYRRAGQSTPGSDAGQPSTAS